MFPEIKKLQQTLYYKALLRTDTPTKQIFWLIESGHMFYTWIVNLDKF